MPSARTSVSTSSAAGCGSGMPRASSKLDDLPHSSTAHTPRLLAQRRGQDGQVRDLLKACGPLEVIVVLGGGNRNTVLEARLDLQRVVVRRSRRPSASLAWEADLLEHLARNGLRVPAVVPAHGGRRHIDGVMVQTWLDGAPP